MKISDLLKEAWEQKLAAERATARFNELKQRIQNYFDKRTQNGADIESVVSGDVIASKRERLYITYFPEKLREKLNKNLFNKVTVRKYFIKDIDAMIELLKAAGVKPTKFKELLDVDIVVDNKAMEQAYKVGDVTPEILKGCYEAKVSKYVDLRERAEEAD